MIYKYKKRGGESVKIEGRLNLHYSNDNFIMFYQGRSVNISDILSGMYVDKSIIKVKISDKYSGKVLFDATGELHKDKIQPRYYSYHIDGQDVEEVLWNNVGRKLVIKINNITVE